VLSMDFRAENRQSQALSPRLQHAVRLLQLSSLDFSTTVRDLMGRNPFLEGEEGDDGEGDEILTADGAATDGEPDDVFAEGHVAEMHDDDRDMWQSDGSSALGKAEDSALSALEMMAADTSLPAHLHGQANLLNLPERVLFMARAIIESLDDDGYLRIPLEELLSLVPVSPIATLKELEAALAAARHSLSVRARAGATHRRRAAGAVGRQRRAGLGTCAGRTRGRGGAGV
jgi:RNA polymerase sigma-54 factor